MLYTKTINLPHQEIEMAEVLYDRYGTERKSNSGDPNKPTFTYQERCSRCGGAGGAEQWRYTGWTCYNCGGTGKGRIVTSKLYTAEKLEKLNAAQAKRNAKRNAEIAAAEAEKAAERDAWLAANSDFIAKLDSLCPFVVSDISDPDYYEVTNKNDRFWLTFRRDFLCKQVNPSENQIAAVEKGIAQKQRDAEASYVGEVGGKVELTLTCKIIIDCSWGSFPTIYSYMHICEDENGNSVVYKGSVRLLGEGQTGRVKATVKEHSLYKGKKQTIIQRPKLLEVVEEV